MHHSFRFRTVYQIIISSCMILAAFSCSFVFAESNRNEQKSVAEIVSKAAQENKILYKLTTLEEFKQIVGQPIKETKTNDGGMEIRALEYSDVCAWFGKMRDNPGPFIILEIESKDKAFDIGQNRQIVLRDASDLDKFDTFWGFANVSLANLDLRKHKTLLDNMLFDTLTKWPEPNKLPEGFKPVQMLEEGKNPGLGIRQLHQKGIDGRGIGIAILDQSLLRDHVEYRDKIVQYEEIDVNGMPPQMHASSVASIAVGKTCGVAPGAALFYFAMRMSAMPDNGIYRDIIDKIIKRNESTGASEKIRVVSISTGTFQEQANFDRWKETLRKAEQHGILVVTCDPAFLKYGTLKHIPGKDANDPKSYRRGKYSSPDDVLLVPAGNRTIASQIGPEVYTFDREGGMSWAAPYLAGLTALAYQVNPDIKPDRIIQLWLETAIKTDAGPVVNPWGFIEAVRKEI